MTKKSKKETEEKYGNNWNPSLNEACINLRSLCILYKTLHLRMADKQSFYNKILANLVTAGLVITSTSFFTTPFYCDTTFIIQIITGLISAIIMIIDRVHSALDLGSSSEEHKRVSLRWNELYNNLDLQLRIDFLKRREATAYVEWVQTSFNTLLEISPSIDESVLKQYKQQNPDESMSHIANNLNLEVSNRKKEDNHKKPKQLQSFLEKFESVRNGYELDRFFVDNIS